MHPRQRLDTPRGREFSSEGLAERSRLLDVDWVDGQLRALSLPEREAAIGTDGKVRLGELSEVLHPAADSARLRGGAVGVWGTCSCLARW